MIEITRVAKTGGPLTKRISLSPAGTLASDGSACIMSRGSAQRVRLASLADLADLIGRCESHEAIALGALDPALPDVVAITTKAKLREANGAGVPDLIARTCDHISYTPGVPALALLDIDTKGMPAAVRDRIATLGDYLPALETVIPELIGAGRVMRASTSTGITRTDTGEALTGSAGLHVFLHVRDGADVERFLKAFHARCWLHGLGWLMVGAGGQLLDRSLIDRMVGAPERLVFEGAPVLAAPLAQDAASRCPVVTEGVALDTVAACPPLTIVEQAQLRELRARETQRLAPDSAKARDSFIAAQAKRITERTGATPEQAKAIVARQCSGVLLPDVVLPFDDPALAGATVADVLADPARFDGETLADPLEGPAYGTCTAKIMRRADGSPWIHSFAHGRTIYGLKHDASAVEAALMRAPPNEAAAALIRLAPRADLAQDDQDRLRDLAARRGGTGKREIEQRLKAARQEHDRQQADEDRNRVAAERRDPRPQISAPPPDAEWLPQMAVLNEVLAASAAPEPPARDIEGMMAAVRLRRVPNMHSLTAAGANEDEADESRLPAPEQPLLTRLDEAQLAELIERHVEYVDQAGRPVHLAASFVKHFHRRTDDALPVIAAIATLPLVLPNGALLAKRGLDRTTGIVFRIPPELLALLPAPADCTTSAVARAMQFLADEWLIDVAADYAGKCILIAGALTVIERSLLPERPAFFVTAGRRGGGKTTTIIMLLTAVMGVRPSAAAWSPNEEERRKALLAYLLEALPAIVWDNIPRGAQISCPHIEKSCTTAFYSDRRLGVSEMVAVPASVVHLFTGNNIGPRGDLASRSLLARLDTDRPDPENRTFKHPDPIGWTEANRGRILAALYVVLLGNPRLRAAKPAPAETRFKMWWHLVGAAVEHAAVEHAAVEHAAAEHAKHVAALVIDPAPDCKPSKVSFKDLFLTQEGDDEETASLAEALAALAAVEWPKEDGRATGMFGAADVARVVNDRSEYTSDDAILRAATIREFLFPSLPGGQTVTSNSASSRLKNHVGEPVKAGERTLCLKKWTDPHTKGLLFYVRGR